MDLQSMSLTKRQRDRRKYKAKLKATAAAAAAAAAPVESLSSMDVTTDDAARVVTASPAASSALPAPATSALVDTFQASTAYASSPLQRDEAPYLKPLVPAVLLQFRPRAMQVPRSVASAEAGAARAAAAQIDQPVQRMGTSRLMASNTLHVAGASSLSSHGSDHLNMMDCLDTKQQLAAPYRQDGRVNESLWQELEHVGSTSAVAAASGGADQAHVPHQVVFGRGRAGGQRPARRPR